MCQVSRRGGALSSVKSELTLFLNVCLPFLLCLAGRKGSRGAGVRAPCSVEGCATGSSVCTPLVRGGRREGPCRGVCRLAGPEENVVWSGLHSGAGDLMVTARGLPSADTELGLPFVSDKGQWRGAVCGVLSSRL